MKRCSQKARQVYFYGMSLPGSRQRKRINHASVAIYFAVLCCCSLAP